MKELSEITDSKSDSPKEIQIYHRRLKYEGLTNSRRLMIKKNNKTRIELRCGIKTYSAGVMDCTFIPGEGWHYFN
jgi:hypothetical protein